MVFSSFAMAYSMFYTPQFNSSSLLKHHFNDLLPVESYGFHQLRSAVSDSLDAKTTAADKLLYQDNCAAVFYEQRTF